MRAATLNHVLQSTGFLFDGKPVQGLHLDDDAVRVRRTRGRVFKPDALWQSRSSLNVYFKYEDVEPPQAEISAWRKEIWNEGFSPLLWLISPVKIDLYNGFGDPIDEGDADRHLLYSFKNVEESLRALDELAGRLALETGRFWAKAEEVTRQTSVDRRLLRDLGYVERELVLDEKIDRDAAQALIGRVIFTQYLIDRSIVDESRLQDLCGYSSLPPVLRDAQATESLFCWLSTTFNGDMFPLGSVMAPLDSSHRACLASFLEGQDPISGQRSLFPYQFDIIPVELISAIYEQFAHKSLAPSEGPEKHDSALRHATTKKDGVHYTRLSLVALVLDEVMDGLTGEESVLDLTCGSGVFLVETLRRLVCYRARTEPLTRQLIRSTLYNQIYGFDISEAAIRVAAFSLYLAALELDPNPYPAEALKFEPLVGETLLIGDAETIEHTERGRERLWLSGALRSFDLIVGNPPWTYKGEQRTAERRAKSREKGSLEPRGEGLNFVFRALDFSHPSTRFGIVLNALSFFSKSSTGRATIQRLLESLTPVTLVNLANLTKWLFANAKTPAIVLFARHRPVTLRTLTVVQVPWTPAAAQTYSFEISPQDILNLPLEDVLKRPSKLKAASVGRPRDLRLYDELCDTHRSLDQRLKIESLRLRVGLQVGSSEKMSAEHLQGLPLLRSEASLSLKIDTAALSTVEWPRVHRPREREIYKAPLLIIREYLLLGAPRLDVAIAGEDLVYTNAFYGLSFGRDDLEMAYLLGGILASSLTTWFLLMTASELGLSKRRVLQADLKELPVPDLRQAAGSDSGKQVIRLLRNLEEQPDEKTWSQLDASVSHLYGLDEAWQTVVQDGLLRAGWQWEDGRMESADPVPNGQILLYAQKFVAEISKWLTARNDRHLRAEVFNLPQAAPLRVVRFILSSESSTESPVLTQIELDLNEVLARIGEKLRVQLETELYGWRELRVYGHNEVFIIKPAARRFWLGISALEDADAVAVESLGRLV